MTSPNYIRNKDLFWGPPLGLAYLASAVSDEGHQAEIVECLGLCPIPVERTGKLFRYGMGDEALLARVRGFIPDLIGISCPYSTDADDALAAAGLMKREYDRDVPVIMGGAHASIRPEELLQNPDVDFVAIGEGEGTLVELCRALKAGDQQPAIDGLLSRAPGGGIFGNPARERIQDLDGIPFPRRDLLPMDKYFKIDRARNGITDIRLPKTAMLTSRGCPGNCVFCAIECTWGRKWIGRSPENIVEEIELLIGEYGIREINFLDDSISVSKSRLRELCELIIQRGIDIKWVPSSGVAIKQMDEDLLSLMKRSGCYRVSFGLESGDPETLRFTRKTYTYEHAGRIIRFANRIGLWTTGSFIQGFPYETREQMEATARFALRSGLDWAFFYCATPYPGTDLFEICMKEGLEVPDWTSLAYGGVDSLYLSADEIARVRNETEARFLKSRALRPWKLLGKIRSLEDLRYVLKVVNHGIQLYMPTVKGQGGNPQ